MKVYFEPTGKGSDGISVKIYVEPTDDGHAYRFDTLGNKYLFAWADIKRAKCFESDELPKKMWQSIQHGTHHALIPNGAGKEWGLGDLKYEKVKMNEVEAYKEVIEKIDDVKTLDEFKELYPTIKKSNRVGMRVIRKLFSICEVSEMPEHNGEMGIAYFNNLMRYHALLEELEIE